ncbi:MAG: hypothetical protein ACTSYB_12170 [Candidatus Helarchaeota archaeon]
MTRTPLTVENFLDANLPKTLNEAKDDFQTFVSNLLAEIEEPDTKSYKKLSDESFINDFKEEYTPQKISINRNKRYKLIFNLANELNKIKKDYSSTVLEDFFEIFINSVIKYFQRKKLEFSSLEEIFNIFSHYGMEKISNKTIEKLIGALQWNVISPNWLCYNFLLEYYKKLPSYVSEELKRQTWILVELTRIKLEEIRRKKEILNEIYK